MSSTSTNEATSEAEKKPAVIVLTGPTAAGKSSLALDLARGSAHAKLVGVHYAVLGLGAEAVENLSPPIKELGGERGLEGKRDVRRGRVPCAGGVPRTGGARTRAGRGL